MTSLAYSSTGNEVDLGKDEPKTLKMARPICGLKEGTPYQEICSNAAVDLLRHVTDGQAGMELRSLHTAPSLQALQQAFCKVASAAHPSAGGSEAHFNEVLAIFQARCVKLARRHHCKKLGTSTNEKPEKARLPVVSFEKCQHGSHFLRELYSLLQRLPPESRRVAIAEKLTQKQRQCLERWMLRRKAAATPDEALGAWNGRKRKLSERSLCKHSQRGGFRPCVHLQAGLYGQARFCKDLQQALEALGVLVVMRSLFISHLEVPLSGDVDKVFNAFASRARYASREALASHPAGADLRLCYRTRRVLHATPLRSSLREALQDWHSLQLSAAKASERESSTLTLAKRLDSRRDGMETSGNLQKLDRLLISAKDKSCVRGILRSRSASGKLFKKSAMKFGKVKLGRQRPEPERQFLSKAPGIPSKSRSLETGRDSGQACF
mmetsp:Transcript_9463/g.16824  ORF Transcript_9463/g.16824 Transcript_9463/m.16824 type:complete len:438 (-) Transcript_9463:11-1324(-)